MTTRVSFRRAELVVTNPKAINDLIGYLEIELYGLLHCLNGKQFGQAIFGTFERTNNRTLLYTATVWTDETGEIYHNYDSEFEDDLNALRRGHVEVFN